MATTDATGRRNAVVLSVCQALFTGAISIDLTLTGLTGYQLAPNKALATLPFAMITVAGAAVTLFASLLMARIGRRGGFLLGAASCLVGGAISFWAVLNAHFWGFCLGTAFVGVFQAFAQYYRLAAADSVPAEAKSRAISIVLAGGVLAAVLGPALAAWSKDLVPTALFSGSYLMVAVLGLASMLVLMLYRNLADAPAVAGAAPTPPRPLALILRTPIFIASAANSMVGSVVMLFVMTAAPLAAVACGHRIDDGANIIQWHLIGMFAPSFVTGTLIKRCGLPAVLFAGMALNVVCVIAAVSSTSLPAFYLALFCLGIGWNFMFTGGTTLLTLACQPSERARTQGVSELMRTAAAALASLGAGSVLDFYGWNIVNLAILPLLALTAVLTFWWMAAERRGRPGLAAA